MERHFAKAAAILLAASSLWGCSEEIVGVENGGQTATVQGGMEVVQVDMAEMRVAPPGVSDSDVKTRAATRASSAPQIALPKAGNKSFNVWQKGKWVAKTMDYVKVQLFICHQMGPTVLDVQNVVELPYEAASGGGYTIPQTRIPVTLPAGYGDKWKQGEFYVSALIQKGDGLALSPDAFVRDGENGKAREVSVPFTAKWTKISPVGTITNLDFKPRGVLFSIRMFSNMVTSLFVNRLMATSPLLSRCGSFDPKGMSIQDIKAAKDIAFKTGEDPNTYVKYLDVDPVTFVNGTYERNLTEAKNGYSVQGADGYAYGNNNGQDLQSGKQLKGRKTNKSYGDGYFYFWAGMPVTNSEAASSGSATQLWAECTKEEMQPCYVYRNLRMAKSAFNQHSKKQTWTTAWKDGWLYPIDLVVTSDLIITEDARVARGVDGYNQTASNSNAEWVHNYGYIEIYNPTLDPVDLSQYGLMRLSVRLHDGMKFNWYPRWNSAGTEVNSQQPANVVDKYSPTGAMVMPLVPEITQWGKYSWGNTEDYGAIMGYDYIHDQHWNSIDMVAKGYGAGKPTASDHMLQPGKTIVILGAGQARDKDDGIKLTQAFGDGDGHINDFMAKAGTTAKTMQYCYAPLAAGFMQHTKRNNSSSTEEENMEQMYDKAWVGVNDASATDSYVLVKHRDDFRHSIVDVSGVVPLTYGYGKGVYNTALGNMMTSSYYDGQITHGKHIRIRRTGELFPRPSHDYRVWTVHNYSDKGGWRNNVVKFRDDLTSEELDALTWTPGGREVESFPNTVVDEVYKTPAPYQSPASKEWMQGGSIIPRN